MPNIRNNLLKAKLGGYIICISPGCVKWSFCKLCNWAVTYPDLDFTLLRPMHPRWSKASDAGPESVSLMVGISTNFMDSRYWDH